MFGKANLNGLPPYLNIYFEVKIVKLKHLSLSLSAIFLIGAFHVINTAPASAGLEEIKEAIVGVIRRPNVKLNLTVYRQNIQRLKNGRKALVWQKLPNNTKVIPGNILRYTVVGRNDGKAEAKNLIITQPIDSQTFYKAGSAKSNIDAEVSYSVNNGKSFDRNPKIEVKLANGSIVKQQAPAEKYTHIRWKFNESIAPNKQVKATYLAEVR